MHRFTASDRRLQFSAFARPLIAAACFTLGVASHAAEPTKKDPVKPVFKDGEAQVVKAFSDPDFWIRHDLWVETEFDSDEDGKLDRMHVSVTRPRQTESEGLKLPVVYVSSPYFAGTGT
ncbi:MAG: hypothetical protein P8L85_23765 [Rubripirellula sp.]|nr:hypothetical protein [Rubripirellula sp.]